MSKDRVKVAGVMMSREEEAAVKAERVRIYGTGITIWRIVLYTLAMWIVLAFLAAPIAFDSSMPRSANRWSSLVFPLIGVVLGFVFAWVDQRTWKRARSRELRLVMNRLGRRVCVTCAFEISNDSPYGDTCPECGEAFEING